MTEKTTKSTGRMESALTNARRAANDAQGETRKAAKRVGKAAEANPLAVVAGGIAIGLAVGALLPRSRRETELLGPTGKRLTGAAAGAVGAAKEAAAAELGSFPLSKDAAKTQVTKLLDQVGKALSVAGEAALNAREATPAAKPAAPRTRKAK